MNHFWSKTFMLTVGSRTQDKYCSVRTSPSLAADITSQSQILKINYFTNINNCKIQVVFAGGCFNGATSRCKLTTVHRSIFFNLWQSDKFSWNSHREKFCSFGPLQMEASTNTNEMSANKDMQTSRVYQTAQTGFHTSTDKKIQDPTKNVPGHFRPPQMLK